nr:unnamed protein product [Callosobruchus analis]
MDYMVVYQDKQARCASCHKQCNFVCQKCDIALHPKQCFLLSAADVSQPPLFPQQDALAALCCGPLTVHLADVLKRMANYDNLRWLIMAEIPIHFTKNMKTFHQMHSDLKQGTDTSVKSITVLEEKGKQMVINSIREKLHSIVMGLVDYLRSKK